LIYARGGVFETALHDLIQVHPDGLTNAIAIGLPMAFAPSISPSGEQVAFSAALTRRGDESALWVHDLRRHITTKVMQGGLWPQWNADGRTLAASYRQAHGEPVFVVAANGSDSVRRVVSSSTTLDLTSWSRSGVFAGVVHGDIWTARIGEVARPFFTSPEIERFATFSPDGRWIAYSATKGIREEVYVRPYPGPEPVVQISTDGGRAPAWARDGRSLYFLSNASPPAMMRAAVSAGTVLSVAPPTVVLKQWPYASSSPGRSYDVFPDGSFLGVTAQGGSSLPAIQSHNKVAEFHVVLNFLQELRTRVK
jgi:Tol biopolymer transport system component